MKMKKISSDSISDWLNPADREQENQIQAGRIAAITWLKLNRKPSLQVAAFLRRQYPEPIVEKILHSLQEDGYIDDQALAKRLVSQRRGYRAESRAALAARMHQLGLEEKAIQAALPEEQDDLDAARELIRSRQSRQVMDWQKAGRFLARRGFNQEVIIQVLRESFSGIDSRDTDQA